MDSAALDVTHWVGRTETVHDTLAPAQALAAAAMFNDPNVTGTVGDAIPPLWHWFYFLPRAPQSALSVDGHPERGGFMPPITLPRRMFAGARVRLHAPLRLGIPAERQATLLAVTRKAGRTGALAFVTVRYQIVQQDVLCLDEEQDIVYREPGAPVAPPVRVPFGAPPPHTLARELHADSRLLFRFSALTFNAHRIHYDRDYAQREEGYPGLVVHGPLIAMLLLQLAQRQEASQAHDDGRLARRVQSFGFRGLAPLFDLAPCRLLATREGDRALLKAQAPDGSTALEADASFASA
jgi:3-methylfumaryl-CoA hydratase